MSKYFIILTLTAVIFSACEKKPEQFAALQSSSFTSFRDIPGATAEEIAAIEELQRRGTPLIYAASRTTELFETIDGGLGGFTVLLCYWLSELFDIEFRPNIQGLGAMLSGLRSGDIDFATLSDTPERRENYFVAGPIAQRSLIMLRVQDSLPLEIISEERLPRYLFTRGSVMIDIIAEVLGSGSYEEIIVENEDDVYQGLVNGRADAFIATNNMEAAFDHYGGLFFKDFLPLVFLPAAMVAENPEMEAVISLVNKALDSGAYESLLDLYRRGYDEYRRNKFLLQLTDEEIRYIRNNPVIQIGAQYSSYPMTFFNANEKKWDGIVFDIIDELTFLTGLEFKIANDPDLSASAILELAEKGDIYAIPYLIMSDERRDRVLWSDNPLYLFDRFALLSKQSFPNVALNDIPFQRVGFAEGSVFAEKFRQWFPNAVNITEYATNDDAIHALDRGEVDLVINTQSRLTALTNYYELSDYKANFMFNEPFEAYFAFNKDHDVLRSIIDKVLPLINTDIITEQWLTRTYNFEAMRLRQQRPYLIGVVVLSLTMFAVLLALFINNIKKSKVITKQTAALSSLLEKTRQVSEYETLKHVLVLKAMNVALWDANNSDAIAKGISPFEYNSPVRYSNEFRRMLDYTDEADFPNFLYSWVNNIHPDDKERAMNDLVIHLKDLSGNTPYDSEYRLMTKNGDYKYIHGIGDTHRDKNGYPVRIAGVIKDITEEKRIAEALAEANRINQNSINSLEMILNSIEAQIYVTVPETGELLFVNNNLKKTFGRENDDLAGEYCYKVFRGFDGICDFCPCHKLNENPHQVIVWEEYIEGLQRNIVHSNCYIDWPNSKKVHLHHGVDITELTQHKIAMEEAKAASEAKSLFLANMSHEIRTPMNSIIGFSELAHNKNNPQKTCEYLNKITENAKMLLALINDILDISKIESGKMVLENIPFDLPLIFEHCRAAIMPKAEEKGLVLHFYTEPLAGKKLIGDPTRLRQVLLNLLSNAVKFTETGTIKVIASIAASTENSATIYFEVKDSGIGMTKDQIDNIFKPFSQADNSITRKYGGTGLGLAITKNIIEMMNGKFNVESDPGVGSSFSFEITLETVDIKHNTLIHSTEQYYERPVFEGDVLVLEDNVMNQQVICDYLERFGLTYTIADNGLKGIEVISERMKENKPFDLIFMDINMPVMDGLEASARIMEMGVKTPIIAMTANVMFSDMELYKEKGMPYALGKPFTSQELINVLMNFFTPVGFTTADSLEEESEHQKMLLALRRNFLKSNKNLYEEIIKSIESGDLILAHRMAHTLKGTSGQIGERSLQKAAADAEKILNECIQNREESVSIKEKIKFLEGKINNVLDNLSLMLRDEEMEKNERKLNEDEMRELFERLETMLKKSNPECMYLINDLELIEGTEELVRLIDDFNFKQAIDELNSIKRKKVN